MKCADCKTELRKDSLFCPHCGASVVKAKTRRKKKVRTAVISAVFIAVVSAAAAVMAIMMKNTTIIGRWVAEDGGVLVFHFDGSFEDGGFDNALPGEYGIYTGVPGLEEVGLGEYQILSDKTLILSYTDFKRTKRAFSYKKDWRLSAFGELYIGSHVYSRVSKHKGLNNSAQNSSIFDVSTRGASSLSELTEILTEDTMFTSDQIRCMSADMVFWMFEEMDLAEYIENDISDVTNKSIARILNLNLDGVSAQMNISGLKKVQSSVIPSYTIAEMKESFFDLIIDELSENPVLKRKMLGLLSDGAVEDAWVAEGTIATKRFEESYLYQLDSDLSDFLENDLIIFQINGRYFWRFIELF